SQLDVLVDLVGYYSPSAPALIGQPTFIDPVRVLDTRGPDVGGPIGYHPASPGQPPTPIEPGQLQPGTTVSYRVGGLSFAGFTFPSDLTGLLMNVTIVRGQYAGAGGWLVVYPNDGGPAPFAATVNPQTEIAGNGWVTATGSAGT